MLPRSGSRKLTVDALVLPRLTVYAGVSGVEKGDWPHLRVDLADPDFTGSDKIDVLLGADVYAAVIGPRVRRRGPRDPVAQQTSLGWIVSGPVTALTLHTATTLHQCSADESLSSLVQKFWRQEEHPRTSETLTAEKRECEAWYARTVTRQHDGRYVVRLPTKTVMPDLTPTKPLLIGCSLTRNAVFNKIRG